MLRFLLSSVLLFAAVVFLCSCGQPQAVVIEPIIPPEPPAVDATALYTPVPIGKAFEGRPWVAHVLTTDLDQDGAQDVVVCEAQDDEVTWLRHTDEGQFSEVVLATEMRAPVRAEVVDMDKDGDLDILVASMSIVFPNLEKIGTVFALENNGTQQFTKRILIENIERVNDVRAEDLNGDGKLDLALGQFGYDQGEVRWMERTGPWEFKSHILLKLSGTVNVCVADFDGNGTPDIAALVSQQWEEIHLFRNDGKGKFSGEIIFGSTNEDFAMSGMSLGDLNQDGRPDLLFTNGDGFGPTPYPGPRPWHGVQWLENKGEGSFDFHRIGDLPGAYSPLEIDVDRDGLPDVIALSCFNNWFSDDAISMMWYRNTGIGNFEPHVLAYLPTHLLTVTAGDFDGSGVPQLVTGAFHAWPPYHRLSRLMLWKQGGDQ